MRQCSVKQLGCMKDPLHFASDEFGKIPGLDLLRDFLSKPVYFWAFLEATSAAVVFAFSYEIKNLNFANKDFANHQLTMISYFFLSFHSSLMKSSRFHSSEWILAQQFYEISTKNRLLSQVLKILETVERVNKYAMNFSCIFFIIIVSII